MDKGQDTLYKYFGPDRSDVLTSRLLRYSPLGVFNDPFEGLPEVTGLDTEEKLLEKYHELLPSLVEKEIDEKFPGVTSWLDKAPKELQHRFSKIELVNKVLEQMGENGPNLVREINNESDRHWADIRSGLDKKIGALCLSEVNDSLLMWAHYGSSHEGFVLGFDVRHSHFHRQRNPDDFFYHPLRVLYREARPREMLTNLNEAALFLTKSYHWSYEREWRIFCELSKADKTIGGSPHPVHLFGFPSDAVTELIFGARASDSMKESMTAAIRNDSELQHIVIKQAEPDKSHFLLRINRV